MLKPTPRFGILAYVLVIAGISFFNKFLVLIADYAWFKEVQLTSVFKVTLFSTWGWGLACGVLAWLAMFINLRWAERNARHVFALSDDEQDLIGFPVRDWRHASRPFFKFGTIGVAFFVAAG